LLTSEWLPDYRVRRIRQLLEAATPNRLSLADHGRIQNDVVSVMAQRFLATALPILHDAAFADLDAIWAREQLQNWDREMRQDSIAATLYFGLLTQFTQAAVEQALGPELARQLLARDELQAGFPLMPFYEIAFEVTMRWLEAGPDAPDWVSATCGRCSPTLC
jgi:acyl-homoserine lactone acylase PvdQ